jgi:hypothetical protein
MRTVLSVLIVLILAITVAACGGPQTTAFPTSDPNNDISGELTAEATAEGTSEAGNTSFSINVTGNTEANLNSDDGATVSEMVAGASSMNDSTSPADSGSNPVGNSSGQSVLNTPSAVLRTLTFTNADQSYTFDLIVSDDLAAGTYEIGLDNVITTVGNNINEDTSGNAQDVNSTAEATSDTSAESTTEASSNALPTMNSVSEATAEATDSLSLGSQNEGSSLNDSNPAASMPGAGIVERDETLPPTIAARFTTNDPDAASYNLIQDGSLTIDEISEMSASGSFEFTLASTEDESQTITVTGTFTALPLVQPE